MNFRAPVGFTLMVFWVCLSLQAQEPSVPQAGAASIRTIPNEEAAEHLLQSEPPTYPPIARAAKIEGDVHVILEVNWLGIPTRVIETSGHPLLTQAAAEAAMQYRYRPFKVNGVPASARVRATVTFSLHTDVTRVPFPEVTDLNSVEMMYDDGWVQIRVHGNGLVQYSAMNQARVVVAGQHECRIDAESVAEMLQAFRHADFYSLQNDYSVAASDLGTTTISLRIGGFSKSVEENILDEAPASVNDVRTAILTNSGSARWIHGDAETVTGLVAESGDRERQKDLLSGVLPRAAMYGDAEVVRDILRHRVNLERRGPYGDTALMLAADRGIPDMVSDLLKAGANPRSADKEGRSALIFGAGSGNADVVRQLLAAGLKGNARDRYGDTALMAAAAAGNPEPVRLLLENGAKVNARNKRHQTALLSASTGDEGFYWEDAFRERADVPEEMIHRDLVVKLLLDAGANINVRGLDGESALFSLEDDAVEELIRHHIDLEMRDKYNDTALTRTVSGSIAGLLIKAGADVNAHGYEGETPLIMAAANNELDKLKVLVVAKGIGLEERDDKNETALMKAQASHLNDAVQILVSAGEKQ